jgi:hypothetical protein
MQVEVQRKSDEGLSRSVWVFYAQTWHGCGPLSVRLERFTNETRKSRRHGWQVASQWPHVRGYNAKPPCDKPTLDELRVLRESYEDKLAALPAWRWLARWVYATAVDGVTARILYR